MRTVFDYSLCDGGEIILRPNGFCNLSEVVVRVSDTVGSLKRKVELATILGTFQSTLTNFRYLRPVWRKNAEDERLLGVSLTGILDNPILNGRSGEDLPGLLSALREHSVAVNKDWAEKLGINQSAAINTIKPSGTVSQLVDSASGIHPRYSKYYIRTVRADKKDPLSTFLIEQGVPHEEDVTKPSNWVFSFPVKAPEGALVRDDLTALQQLEIYRTYHKYWCEHNPSITVYVREHEWLEVAAWCYKHFDELGGVSFLPFSDHVYKQAPFQPCTEEEYLAAVAKMPQIDWDTFAEDEDNVGGYKEMACVGGSCDIL